MEDGEYLVLLYRLQEEDCFSSAAVGKRKLLPGFFPPIDAGGDHCNSKKRKRRPAKGSMSGINASDVWERKGGRHYCGGIAAVAVVFRRQHGGRGGRREGDVARVSSFLDLPYSTMALSAFVVVHRGSVCSTTQKERKRVEGRRGRKPRRAKKENSGKTSFSFCCDEERGRRRLRLPRPSFFSPSAVVLFYHSRKRRGRESGRSTTILGEKWE